MLHDLLYSLRALIHRREMDAEMDDELRDHIERETEKYRRAGFTPNEAVRRAHLALGGSEQVKQQSRDSRGTKFVEDILQDLRYAMRSFAKTPGLTALIVLSLAIGIGANTAIFSITSTLLLKPLPYPALIGSPSSGFARRVLAFRRTGLRRDNITTSLHRTTSLRKQLSLPEITLRSLSARRR